MLMWWIKLFIPVYEFNVNSYLMADLNNFVILLSPGKLFICCCSYYSRNKVGAIEGLININAR